MDERAVFAGGSLLIVLIFVMLTFFGRRMGGVYWAFAWLGLYLSGAVRNFAGISPFVDAIGQGFATLLPVMLVFGTWQFTSSSKPMPRSLAICIALVIPLRATASFVFSAAEARIQFAIVLSASALYLSLIHI